MDLVFAGTPDCAVPVLAALLDSHHRVRLVITQPDRAAGRGRRNVAPPVKSLALTRGVPVLQPEDIGCDEVAVRLKEAAPEAIVVVAYGQKLPGDILQIPTLGCFNIHFSLLPRHRGAAPVQHAILCGDSETGVTIQRMEEQIDTGRIIAQRKVKIEEDETAGRLTERLAALAAEMIVPTLDAVAEGRAVERPQDPALVTFAPRLRKSDGWVPWHMTAEEVHRFIRAMTPWPGAFTIHSPLTRGPKRRLVVLASRVGPERRRVARDVEPGAGRPGRVVMADPDLVVATGSGLLTILRVKPEGGREMDAAAFLRGHPVHVGDWFVGPT